MNVALPQLPQDLITLTESRSTIEKDEPLVCVRIENCSLTGINAGGARFSEVSLLKVTLGGAAMEKLDWSDVLAVRCDFTAANCEQSSWRRVHVKGSRCSGMLLHSAKLQDATFENCKLDLANFRFTKLKNVRFVDCVLDKADFYQAELKSVTFENCTLSETEFSQAKLDKVDLRTSDLTGIKGVENMKGAIINSTQLIYLAPLLVAQLGIIVED